MKTGLYFNRNFISDYVFYIEKIKKMLSEYGHECIEINSVSDLDGVEILFVLGGDGTILTIAAECALRNVKIIGINYGHVGFLTECEQENFSLAAELVCRGNYKTVKRSMIQIDCGTIRRFALNDVVIQRNTSGINFTNTVNIHAEIDGTTVDNFSSDGIIISTPTGSTAYSLSAGGSVLSPDIRAFILTPICPHSLHSRPVVFSDESVFKAVPVNTKEPLVLIVDGHYAGEINNNQTVTISKADCFAEFITADTNNFFNKLLIKLNKWSK